jgi:hypothetical protein
MALEFLWQDATSETDPGAGNLNFNGASWPDVTAIAISTADRHGSAVAGWLDALDDSSSTIKGTLRIEKTADAAAWAEYRIFGTTIGSGFRLLAVTFLAQGTSFTDGDIVAVTATRTGDAGLPGDGAADGDAGTNGVDGTPASLQMMFSTSTTNADPGSGYLRFNQSIVATATYIYADAQDRFGNAISAWLDTLDDSDNGTYRSLLTITKAGDPSIWALAKVTGDVEAPGGWRRIPIVVLAVSSVALANDDTIAIGAALAGPAGDKGEKGDTGDKGDTGATGPAIDPDAFVGASATVLIIEQGMKVFETDTDRVWFRGQRLRAASLDGAKVMEGAVSEYWPLTGNLTIAVDFTRGAGAHDQWTIGVTGERGDTGTSGPTGSAGSDGDGLQPDATGTLAQRAVHDAAAQGFLYLQTDVLPFRLWAKASATSGDWTGPTTISGNEFAVGDWGLITDPAAAIYDFGTLNS